MDDVEFVTIVFRMPLPLRLNDSWPESIKDMLASIGQRRPDGTEVVGFICENSLSD